MLKLLLILLLSVLSFGCKSKQDSDNIYFAWVGPLTGSAMQVGLTQMMAVEFALEDIMAAGGVLGGKQIVVNFYDDQNDAEEAINIANRRKIRMRSGWRVHD